jgi:RNA polymerase sigma factor (sigma-70 family)
VIDAAHWDAERARLTGVAYRMLGSAADAEDVVQEALLRATQAPPLESPRAWLTTVVTRLCLDALRSARRRRTTYVGTWLPEPVATDAPLADARLVETESLSLAFLRLLQTLSPPGARGVCAARGDGHADARGVGGAGGAARPRVDSSCTGRAGTSRRGDCGDRPPRRPTAWWWR